MRSVPPAVAPFFRSDAQGRILAAILLDGDERPLTDVAAGADTPLTTVQREVGRLETAGVVTSRKVGPARLVKADPAYPLREPLTQIVAATYGPAQAVREAFADLDGVEHLIIFGSWAARICGQPGGFPGDLDVLVVGTASRLAAIDRAITASERIGREVNVTVVVTQRWADASDGFIADIKSKPYLTLEPLHDQ
ncbi:MAG: winged helix-turn-helix domain-containing protein [Micrococcales bacterium]|nr:winged helix-turn-helix domain-containing protein [Micrococcales bacterium]